MNTNKQKVLKALANQMTPVIFRGMDGGITNKSLQQRVNGVRSKVTSNSRRGCSSLAWGDTHVQCGPLNWKSSKLQLESEPWNLRIRSVSDARMGFMPSRQLSDSSLLCGTMKSIVASGECKNQLKRFLWVRFQVQLERLHISVRKWKNTFVINWI